MVSHSEKHKYTELEKLEFIWIKSTLGWWNIFTLWKTTSKSSSLPCRSPQIVACFEIAVDTWFRFGKRFNRYAASLNMLATYLACRRLLYRIKKMFVLNVIRIDRKHKPKRTFFLRNRSINVFMSFFCSGKVKCGPRYPRPVSERFSSTKSSDSSENFRSKLSNWDWNIVLSYWIPFLIHASTMWYARLFRENSYLYELVLVATKSMNSFYY